MTSEIRANSITSRAGLSTVTLTDSGPMFSGITTFVDNSTFSVGTGGTIHAPATNTLNIGVNNTESLRIDSNSNLKVAGIVTATSFVGSGANLTSLPAQATIANNADNRLITGGSGVNLNGEANLNFDGTGLGLVGHIDIRTGSSINTNVTGGSASGTLHKNTTSGEFAIVSGGTGGNNHLSFYTSASAAPTEKLRIDSNGSLLINGTTSFGSPVKLQVRGASSVLSDGAQIFDIASTATANGGTRLAFGVNEDNYTWIRSYESGVGSRDLVFAGVSEYGRFDSSGRLRVASTTESADGAFDDVIVGNHSGNRGISILSGATSQGAIGFAKSGTLADGYVAYNHNSTATSSSMVLKSSGIIKFNAGSVERLRIKSNGAIALPDGTQGIRFGSAASEDFAVFHSGSNSHIDHFGTGNLYHDFSNDFYMRFYQSAGVVRTALYISNGGSGNPEFQLRSNPTSASTNSGTDSPAVKFRGAGWNTNSGSVEVGTRLVSDHSYWQSSFANVFGQTYPDFQIQYKNSDSGSYVAKVNIDGRAGMMMSSSGGAGFGFGNFSSRAYYARMTEYFGAAQDVGLNFWTTTNAGGSLVNHFRIDHNGDLRGTDTSISSISDSRVKKDVVDYTYDLSKFKLYTPKQFNWINPEMHGDKTNVKGFLAQDLEAIDTQWVGESFISKDDPDCELVNKSKNSIDEEVGVLKTSKFGDKDAMYVSVIQQLMSKIETLEAKVETLEQENIAIRVRVTNLEGE